MAHTETANKSQPHRIQRKQALETRREREFYRYYEPIQALTESGPSLCDLDDADSVKAHRPLSSPDRALTAFCQLGALRLGCRRAMLFFFDRNYAYVLAEATRTLSLQDDSVHEEEDSLWLGHTVIPRGYTICEETVCRTNSGDGSESNPISHIINDLDDDTQFCGKPYVTDGPKAKFYAGVPITTDRGVNIGAYCCLDDRKRVDGLDANGIIFLQDMAKTVMTHLEMVRAKSEQDRSTRMVKSLGAFVEGAASMQSWEKETGRRDYRRVGGRSGSPAKRPPLEPIPSPTTANGVHNTKNVNDTLARRAMRRQGRVDDGKEIRRLFPGVRSLALCGMWDQNRGRWFSACAVWTYAPLRLLSESETNYMAAFCDVVMAEIYRLEAQNSDRMKADFISSISHELRSPLHGILGSVECLQELSFADSFHSDLVSQIEVCGRTLLDIVEHLLDYKKMNTPKPSIPKEDAKPSPLKRPTLNDTRKTSMGAMMSLESQVSLDEVTEETVSSAVYSFCCARSKENILNRRVAVLLDIDRAESVNWQCKVALGAWKRICINLVSNALKYTSEGFIHVSLKAVPIPGKRKRFNAVFTVQDSGRGMSKDFLANHFFRPFSQEDTLMEGTGLGMSLVAKIVRAMAGQVDVQSEKGRGTTMTVVVPIEVGRPSKAKKLLGAVAESLSGCSVGILGFGDARIGADAETADGTRHELARTKLLQSTRLSCEQLGLDVKQMNNDNVPDADVYIIAEADLSRYAQSKQLTSAEGTRYGLDKPLVVVCNSAISVRQLRASSAAAGFTTERLEYTAQPLGTTSLGKAIRNCLSTDSTARDLVINPQDATVGAASPRTVETIRPYQHDGIDERSGRLPIRVRAFHSSSASDQDQPPLPPITDMPSPHPLQRVANSTVAAQPDATSDGYLSTRSKSTGDRPLTPRAVEQVSSGKDPVTSNAKSVIAPSGLSLLLVDDNQINLQLLVNYARKQGHRKATASDGQQAVDAYKAACLVSGHVQSTASDPKTTDAAAGKDGTDTSTTLSEKPQVILMDISMPVLNGFEATRLIRAYELQHGLQPAHIIALTGLGSAGAQQEAFSSGVDLFLTKPVRLKELTKLLDGIKSGDHARADTPVPK
ncbi:hypothetical protein LTR22_024090 [Elasticomyces elasticus]|nr:hypothetical protein LTR22_024090 [Elasticomyces elasticus]KAK4906390.1 hypothetical protein LTR49_024472 [Elasticomyces elasticus]KAK5744655.1 hypothetical protein LTS12_023431 [Elasticomyces elasticus]